MKHIFINLYSTLIFITLNLKKYVSLGLVKTKSWNGYYLQWLNAKDLPDRKEMRVSSSSSKTPDANAVEWIRNVKDASVDFSTVYAISATFNIVLSFMAQRKLWNHMKYIK